MLKREKYSLFDTDFDQRNTSVYEKNARRNICSFRVGMNNKAVLTRVGITPSFHVAELMKALELCYNLRRTFYAIV